MNQAIFMQQDHHITGLLFGLLSGTLTSEEKCVLYYYVIDDSHKDEIMACLQEQWLNPLWQTGDEISSEAMFARIRTEIEKQVTVSAQQPPKRKIRVDPSKIIHQEWKMIFRYAAVFIIAFGLSWVLQKTSTNPADTTVVAETSPLYNEILVPYGSKTKVILPDSSTVWLNAGARLKYPTHFDGNRRTVFLQGEGFFDVTRDSQHPFIVNSNGINIKVLGTKFNLMANADDNFIETTLVEGAIEILGVKDNIDRQKNLVLKSGQKLTLHKENEKYRVQNIQEAGLSIPKETIQPVKIKSANRYEKANVEQATAWTENKLVFTKERFGDVKTKLERWYGVTIEVKDPEILDYRFTGTFEKQTFEQAMNALSKAASCKFKIEKNHVIVSK